MKKFSFFLVAVISVMLFSCNSGTQTEQAKDTSSDAATTSTTVTAPVFMPFDIVRLQFKVKDYGKWYAGFMSHDSIRLANGIHKYVVDRGLNGDSNMVIVVSKIDDLQMAKAFYSSAQIKKAMQQGGIIGMPKFEYLHIISNDTTTIPQDRRVSVTHHVKNFEAWLKVYDGEGKDTRAANGIVDRAMARGIEDSNMVSIVFVVTDMDKAKARIASPDLKKLMTDAGVDSAPDITFYRVVERF
ncbi:hypothetical protein BH11BAC6_BH11BAC6_09890 [soil metagenome]